MLLHPDSNVIDSNYTRDLNGNATTCDKLSREFIIKKCINADGSDETEGITSKAAYCSYVVFI